MAHRTLLLLVEACLIGTFCAFAAAEPAAVDPAGALITTGALTTGKCGTRQIAAAAVAC